MLYLGIVIGFILCSAMIYLLCICFDEERKTQSPIETPLPARVYSVKGKLVKKRAPKFVSEEQQWLKEQNAPPEDPT